MSTSLNSPGSTTLNPASLSEVRSDLVEKIGLSKEEADQIVAADDLNIGAVTKHSEDAEAVSNALGTCFGGGPGDPGHDIPLLSKIDLQKVDKLYRLKVILVLIVIITK